LLNDYALDSEIDFNPKILEEEVVQVKVCQISN
jgi:hypothetical protein